MYAIVIDPPHKNLRSFQDAYDVAEIIAKHLVFDLWWRELHHLNKPTKSMINRIRKYGATLTFINEDEFLRATDDINHINLFTGDLYTVTRYKMAEIK
jgi:hypothetical protein